MNGHGLCCVDLNLVYYNDIPLTVYHDILPGSFGPSSSVNPIVLWEERMRRYYSEAFRYLFKAGMSMLRLGYKNQSTVRRYTQAYAHLCAHAHEHTHTNIR